MFMVMSHVILFLMRVQANHTIEIWGKTMKKIPYEVKGTKGITVSVILNAEPFLYSTAITMAILIKGYIQLVLQ